MSFSVERLKRNPEPCPSSADESGRSNAALGSSFKDGYESSVGALEELRLFDEALAEPELRLAPSLNRRLCLGLLKRALAPSRDASEEPSSGSLSVVSPTAQLARHASFDIRNSEKTPLARFAIEGLNSFLSLSLTLSVLRVLSRPPTGNDEVLPRELFIAKALPWTFVNILAVYDSFWSPLLSKS